MELTDRYRRIVAAAGVSAVCFTVYFLTLGPGPFWQDSGLFHAAVRAGGGLAPPGYPVYLILARPFVRLYEMLIPGRPLGEPVNAFSALWGALSAGLIALSVMLLLTPGYRFMARALPRPFPALKGADLPPESWQACLRAFRIRSGFRRSRRRLTL